MSGGKKPSPGESAARELYGRLKPLQEKKGYYFNPDMGITLSILEELLSMKNKYGYMCCPCRLSSGNREKDSDIFCPCVYREPDVTEHGTCYCGLYVDKECHDNNKPRKVIPERRPVGRILA